MSKASHAYGFCDKTGFRYPIKDLIEEWRDGNPTGLLVGRDVVDEDHPQYAIDEVVVDDPVPLVNPRPDTSVRESRGLFAWNPVGGGVTSFGSVTIGLEIKVVTNKVTVA